MENVQGLGQPKKCGNWVVAYRPGYRPAVRIAGSGFSFQKALNALQSSGASSRLFHFQNEVGLYQFAYDGGVIKFCTDGMQIARGRNGGFVASPVHARRGMGRWMSPSPEQYAKTVIPSNYGSHGIAGLPRGVGQVAAAAPGVGWQNYAWTYSGTDPSGTGAAAGSPVGTKVVIYNTALASGAIAPPNAVAGAGGNLGAWVQLSPSFWVWYPAGQLVTMYGGDGNTYWIYSSNFTASGELTGPPPPTAPPPNAPAGSWVNTYSGYYVWVPTAATGLSTTSLLLLGLLGLGVIGGVAYFILD